MAISVHSALKHFCDIYLFHDEIARFLKPDPEPNREINTRRGEILAVRNRPLERPPEEVRQCFESFAQTVLGRPMSEYENGQLEDLLTRPAYRLERENYLAKRAEDSN